MATGPTDDAAIEELERTLHRMAAAMEAVPE